MSGFDLSAIEKNRGGVYETECRKCGADNEGRKSRGLPPEETREFAPARLRRDPGPVMDECVIAWKVYDHCKKQICLGVKEINFPRATETVAGIAEEGMIIEPPENAVDVALNDFGIADIVLVKKEPNQLREGYFDVILRFVFRYSLTFFDVENGVIGEPVPAESVFTAKFVLFGSEGANTVSATDLFGLEEDGELRVLRRGPFVKIDAKAIDLDVKLHFTELEETGQIEADAVIVTIGLFLIIDLFRLVNLSVESRGFCAAPTCPITSPADVCEEFYEAEFPINAFAPLQKREFFR